jgi:type I restriction enzyme M protein
LLHILKSLKTTGKAAVILPHGVLFRGNAEAEIRKNILQKGYIKGIIGLPANLFYGTGIPACIIILDKENANARKGVFFMDASKGFAKDGNKNRLREQDIRKIVDTFETLQEVPKFSRVVSFQEIENNDYNLNIPRYIDNQELADVQDIRAHLLGGIPQSDIDALADYWAVFPRLRAELFTPTRAGYAQTTLPADALKTHIFEHADFQTYHQHLHQLLQNWQTLHFPLLENIHQQKNAKSLISQLSENILQSFEHQQLIEKYDIYQLLLTYWLDTMQDDVYAVVSDGWQLPILMGKKGEWTCELVPKRLVIQRYFQSEQTAIEQLEAHRDDISRQIEELTEEHNTEDGLLVEARNEKDALTTSSVKDRLKKLKNTNATEEKKILENFLTLSDNLAEAKKKIAQAQTALDDSLLAKYKTLSVPEIQTLLIRDKWFADLRQHFQNELDRLSQGLTQRVHTLAQRYQDPLAQLTASTQTLENTVLQHLQTLGFELA